MFAASHLRLYLACFSSTLWNLPCHLSCDRNLWNVNLKHMITDASGMYWRERRLPTGLYTDGSTVYEASYRYRDGRNGMHRVSSFSEFINSRSIPQGKKDKIVQRLAQDTPDVVLED